MADRRGIWQGEMGRVGGQAPGKGRVHWEVSFREVPISGEESSWALEPGSPRKEVYRWTQPAATLMGTLETEVPVLGTGLA